MTYLNLNEAFTESIVAVNRSGDLVNSRGSLQKEMLFFNCTIDDPTDLDIEVPIRKFKPDYAIAEFLWYVSRSKNVQNIGKLASIWNKIADWKNEAESNYGEYIFQQFSVDTLDDQWTWVKNELINDPDSRRGTIVINQPYHKTKNINDYPCTQYLHFFIRNNQLHMGVQMRSNDAVFGFCNDVFTFSMFQQLMLNDLNSVMRSRHLNTESKKIKLGKYYHSAGSFHVYETHFNMMQKITDNYYKRCAGKYPTTLEKFTLNPFITTTTIKEMSMPTTDMSREDIKNFVEEKKELLYV